jgi:hypothetical protein
LSVGGRQSSDCSINLGLKLKSNTTRRSRRSKGRLYDEAEVVELIANYDYIHSIYINDNNITSISVCTAMPALESSGVHTPAYADIYTPLLSPRTPTSPTSPTSRSLKASITYRTVKKVVDSQYYGTVKCDAHT